MSTEPRPPRVWVTYKDSRKDMSKAERFGQLTDMFSGRVNYSKAVEQARRMLEDYRDGDYILLLGDPTVSAIVAAVALEFSESFTLKLLRWDRDEVDYQEVFLDYNEPGEEPTFDDPPPAEVSRKSRWG